MSSQDDDIEIIEFKSKKMKLDVPRIVPLESVSEYVPFGPPPPPGIIPANPQILPPPMMLGNYISACDVAEILISPSVSEEKKEILRNLDNERRILELKKTQIKSEIQSIKSFLKASNRHIKNIENDLLTNEQNIKDIIENID